ALPIWWRVLAMLQSGCALDLLGRREEAIQQYKTVLSMNDYDNAHAHASEHLQSPYTVPPNSVSLPRLPSQGRTQKWGRRFRLPTPGWARCTNGGADPPVRAGRPRPAAFC